VHLRIRTHMHAYIHIYIHICTHIIYNAVCFAEIIRVFYFNCHVILISVNTIVKILLFCQTESQYLCIGFSLTKINVH
jgi:hypothetical protein